MVARLTAPGNRLFHIVNVACLILAIFIVLVLPRKKEIWYDETVSILCSKGISHDSQNLFAKDSVVSSSSIEALNTPENVFVATVVDNGNSFLYNIGLHWFTQLSGNSVPACMLFSKLSAIATLIVFYFLCNLLFKNNLFTSLALVFLAADPGFLAMSHEIRGYSLCIFLVALGGLYLFKYLYESERPVWLFLTAFFSAAAILTHFLSIYIILVFIGVLVARKKFALLSPRNILAIAGPLALLAIYFYCSLPGISTMSMQNHAIQEKFAATQFSIAAVVFRSMKIMAINFKVVFPAFRDSMLLFIFSFFSVIFLFAAGLWAAIDRGQKRVLSLLFVLGAGSSIFLVLLSLKSGHYASLYFRYYSFGLPFSCLYVAYLLYVFSKSPRVKPLISGALHVLILVPVLTFFVIALKQDRPEVHYNHVGIAARVVKEDIRQIAVPTWRDAFLVQSVLPRGFKIDYFRNTLSPEFVLYPMHGIEKIPVVRDDH